jgi:hypothetical protein
VDVFAEAGQTLARAAAAYPNDSFADVLETLSAGASPLDRLKLDIGVWPS